ncbi:MAG: dihydrolipoyl dehydrogenase [Phycisphaeraceae bacterium]
MASDSVYDIVIIGGGPAGYVGSIRAGQLGLKVACVERDKLGGICNNWGCIPTKALLANAELYHRIKHEAAAWGIEADNVRHNWEKVIGRSRGVADMGAKGVAALFKKNKVTHIQGHARIVSGAEKGGVCKVEIHDRPDHVAQTIEAKNVIIATGAGPRTLPGAGPGAGDGAAFDGDKIISYKEAMALKEQPRELLIVGAGAIGMEFAYFYNCFGTKVMIVEMLDRLLPIEDREASAAVERSFRKQGIEVRTAHKTTAVRKTDAGVEIDIAPVSGEGKTETLRGDKVLVAIGVKGKFDGLLADTVKVEIVKDHIKVDKTTYATNVKGIYAVGDVIGPPWLAHVASEEAIICVERIAGHHPLEIDYGAIPGCTYCQPQVASLGLTEEACKQQGLKYKVGKFPYLASGKARAVGNTEGFVKLISDEKTGELLGAHMVGEAVTELLAEMGLAKRLEATTDEIIATMHAHPTLSEAIHEAALGTQGRMLHF